MVSGPERNSGTNSAEKLHLFSEWVKDGLVLQTSLKAKFILSVQDGYHTKLIE
jgi:hypothetical protein